MQLIHTIKELSAWRKDKDYIALIPTMGNLHEGHLQLVRAAKKITNHIVVSLFVNPTQFCEGEDFNTYPRTLEADTDKLFEEGVSVVFAPAEKEIYPEEQQFFIEPPAAIQNRLCGAFRPGHFRGVATIVAKLFNIVQPNLACFGKKDYQQLFIIKQMVTNLNFPVEIHAVDTCRAKDGLALSSRNGYLSTEQRSQAPQLYQTLTQLKQTIINGNIDYTTLTQQAKESLTAQGWKVDYLEIADASTLEQATLRTTKLVILVAAYLGSTRLIDNIDFPLLH